MTGFFRFVVASGLGFLLDLFIALVLHEAARFPLWSAAATSFFVVALMNYLLFELWVFPSADRGLSARRAVGVLLASAVAVAARVGTVLVLDLPVARLLGTGRAGDVTVLVAAAGVSLIVNFAINRAVVFGSRAEDIADARRISRKG